MNNIKNLALSTVEYSIEPFYYGSSGISNMGYINIYKDGVKLTTFETWADGLNVDTGSVLTIEAVAKFGYEFDHFIKFDGYHTIENNYTVTLTDNSKIVVYFRPSFLNKSTFTGLTLGAALTYIATRAL